MDIGFKKPRRGGGQVSGQKVEGNGGVGGPGFVVGENMEESRERRAKK